MATGLLVAALILGAGRWADAGPTAQPPAPAPAPPALAAPTADGLAGGPASAALVKRFALNVLLATLIDDDEPPRWTDVGLQHFCGPDTRVEVDGRPMVTGARIPPTAFTVRWHIDLCVPFESTAVALSGIVDLQVTHDDGGLSAVVDAQQLSTSNASGSASRLGAPFAASLALISAAGRQ